MDAAGRDGRPEPGAEARSVGNSGGVSTGVGGHPGGKPAGHPHGGVVGGSAVDPVVRGSVPRWGVVGCVLLSWLQTAGLVGVFAVASEVLVAATTGVPVAVRWGWWFAGWVLVAAVAAAGLGWLRSWLVARCTVALREALVAAKVAAWRPGAPVGGGDFSALVMQAVEKTAAFRAGFIGPMLGNLTAPFVALLIVGGLGDWVAAAAIGLCVLLVPVAVAVFRRFSKPVGVAYRQANQALSASFLAAVGALEMLVYANAADRVEASLAARGETLRRRVMQLLRINQLLILVVDGVFFLATVLVGVVVLGVRASQGAIDPAAALLIMLVCTLVVGPVDSVGQFFYIGIAGRATQRAMSGALAGLRRQTGRPVPDTDSRTALSLTPADGADCRLRLVDVAVGFGHQEPLVAGVSFTARPGEIVAIVGDSGVGKSTLLSAVAGAPVVTHGTIFVGDTPVTPATSARLRELIAVVEQQPLMFHDTIRANLVVANPSASADELAAAVEIAGLSATIARLPQGLDTPVGDAGGLVSGGQAQRISIARAALANRPIVLLDEPTSQVDLHTEQQITSALRRLARGRVTLIVSHRPAPVALADQVINLNDYRPAGPVAEQPKGERTCRS
ncbi:Iron import ATP-binding/permease protein IrtB [Corynebacterium choanae]|uniref:Iron import ATP-binding/permease protein IrtB n=2 Tax=Corynebacterium choanae TaxID=1862358 RepID=A0A3G6JCB2_9CORY|nr:Iron import ATP-binding/permease protein IrtB [Corynebacterium choanae]